MADGSDSHNDLARIEAAVAQNPKQRPVRDWSPERTGEIDIRIAADGSWYHEGGRIERESLVQLFASILRRDPDGRHYLVTPVEKLGIVVEDAPFLAVHMDTAGEDETQVLGFRTNLGDYVKADDTHRLRFEEDAGTGGLKPYIDVRDGLEALVSRALAYDLMERASVHEVEGEPWFGVWSGGVFFAIAPETEVA